MTSYQLTIFNSVYELNSLQKAAKKHNISQPAVSRVIKDLENYYHKPLFIKHGRMVTVTKDADILYNYSKQVLSLLDSAGVDIGVGEDTIHELKIGAISSVAEILLPKVISSLKERYPGLSLTISVDSASHLINQLLQKKVDIILTDQYETNPMYDVIPLFSSDMTAFCAPDAEYPSEMTLKEFSLLPLFVNETNTNNRRLIDTAFSRNKMDHHYICESNSNPFILSCVRQNLGVGFFSKKLLSVHIENGDVREIHITDYNFKKDYFLCHSVSMRSSYEVKTILNEIQKALSLNKQAETD